MYITKTLALPALNETDCIKITAVKSDRESPLLNTLRFLMTQDDFDIADDELLAHIAIAAGLFTYREWQSRICSGIREVGDIDYEVDSTKRRLNLAETIYQMGGFTGRVTGGGYKMLAALRGRDLVFRDTGKFREIFGSEPREYIEQLWQELEALRAGGEIIAVYTDELLRVKHHKEKMTVADT